MRRTRRLRRIRALVFAAVCSVAMFALVAAANAQPIDNGPINVRPVTQSPSPVVHTVVKDHGDQTLAIWLAGSALGVALAGAGFAVLRVGRMPRPASTH
jgi:hypothetical protein